MNTEREIYERIHCMSHQLEEMHPSMMRSHLSEIYRILTEIHCKGLIEEARKDLDKIYASRKLPTLNLKAKP